MLASPPLKSYEFAGDFRKIGDLSAGDLAGRVQLAVGAGDDPGGHHAC